MYSESHNWKWMVPGMILPLLMLLARAFYLSPHEWVRWVGMMPGFAALICAIAAVSNFFIYLRDQNTAFIERKYGVMNETYTARELRAAQGVHPQVAQMILGERDRLWRLKAGDVTVGIIPHSVLFDAPSVTDMFFMYFLEYSSATKVMPMHGRLVEGRKNVFDPHRQTDEYTMYRDLIAMLAMKRIIVQWNNFSAWEWNQPWDPALVAANWGLELETPSAAEAASPPNSEEQERHLGEKETVTINPPAKVEDEITDEDWKAIKDFEIEHEVKNKMTREIYDSLPKDVRGHALIVQK